MSAASRHARNTGHGAPSTPRLGRCLVPGLGEHRIGLAMVLVHVSMHGLHDVRPNGCQEHLGKSNLQGQQQRIGKEGQGIGRLQRDASITNSSHLLLGPSAGDILHSHQGACSCHGSET